MLMKMNRNKEFWCFSGHTHEQEIFGQVRTCVDLGGEEVSADKLSNVTRTATDTGVYYIKQYWSGGRLLRRFMGRSRAQGEWENLLYFASLGISTPRLVAYGRGAQTGKPLEVLVTEEVQGSKDLATLAREKPARFAQHHWTMTVMRQVADYTRRLHRDNFVHWDLKWRNILVQGDADPKVYFFDCPLGRRWYGGLQRRGAIKDLGCLDSVARSVLTRTQRLRFLLLYRQEERLTPGAKRQIHQIEAFLTAKARKRAKRRNA